MTETSSQEQQGVSHGDMSGILWLVALPHRQPLQTSCHLTPQLDASSLCLVWEGPGTKGAYRPAGSQATLGVTQEPWPFLTVSFLRGWMWTDMCCFTA